MHHLREEKIFFSPLQSGQLAASQHQPWPGPVYSLGHTALSPRMMHPQEQYPAQMWEWKKCLQRNRPKHYSVYVKRFSFRFMLQYCPLVAKRGKTTWFCDVHKNIVVNEQNTGSLRLWRWLLRLLWLLWLSSPSLEAGQWAVGCIHLRCTSPSSAPALEPRASRTQSRSQWNLRKADIVINISSMVINWKL